ncbi:MAG TPA: CapA family protein [Nitrospirota bacterium]|nr:CapA family protein [Nitrospirota bacterium]
MKSFSRTVLLVFSLFVFISPACVQRSQSPSSPSQKTAHTVRTEIVIAAVGDVMMPGSIQATIAKKKYNYDLLFEKVTLDLSAADITFANLETPVDHGARISGYPKFNARPELLASLKRAGVDIVSIANNHIMDAGVAGLKRTLGNIDAAGLVFVGAGSTKAGATEIKRITAKDMTVAFLAYTYSTNERLPRRKPDEPGVNILRTDSEADLALAVERVKEAGQSSDLVVVSLHWGDEYAAVPTAWQRQVAEELIETGADIILGHHPHVLQPIESHTAEDGRQGLIVFSLGNFISTQNSGVSYKNKNSSRARRGDGIILSITIVKEAGKTSISRADFLPIWTLRDMVGRSRIFRPVSLAREIERLNAITERSRDEEGLLKLLSYRREVILKKLTKKPE